MDRHAIFVDAGYLFSQGAVTLIGHKVPRQFTNLEIQGVVDQLLQEGRERFGTECLRIYWYDGAGVRGASDEQSELAFSNDVKLRLGVINKSGQQKGVDSLIVTDLIELARNRAISSAILLSGDEDIRVGVLLAQSFGVRVHLLGIVPARGSQSDMLMQEADTTSEWTEEVVSKFLSLEQDELARFEQEQSRKRAKLDEAAQEYYAQLEAGQIQGIRAALEESDLVPSEYDRILLTTAADKLERRLSQGEKRQVRTIFKQLVMDQE